MWSHATCQAIRESLITREISTKGLARHCGIAEATLKAAIARRAPVSLQVHDRAMEKLMLAPPGFPFDNDPQSQPDKPRPTNGPRCPSCNAPAMAEKYRSIRPDGTYLVTQLHCPNNRKSLKGVCTSTRARPCPIHKTEEKIA